MTPSRIENGLGVAVTEGGPERRGDSSAAGLIARIESVPFSKWHAKATVIMGSATFFDGFNALSLAFALPILVRLWHIPARQVGFLISSGYVGQLLGALLFGWLAEKFGRVPSSTLAVAIMSFLGLACVFAGNFRMLFALRFIQGIGVGGEVPVAAAYINELSQARGRGKVFLLYQMIFPIGLMATGQVGAWIVPHWGWKPMFLVGGIPGVLITVLLWRLPESPRWLISKGRFSEAEAIVRQIESSTERRVVAPVMPIPAAAPSASTVPAQRPGKPQQSRWTELFSRFYIGRTLVVWALWASAYFIANSLNNWLPSLYNTVYHLSLKNSLQAASLTNVAQVAFLIVCAFCIDRIGRRNWMFGSFVVGGALLAILAFNGAHTARSVIILGTLSYGVIGSANAVLYLYTPEIYPTRMRAIGTGLATSWLRLASAVGPTVVGLMVETKGIGAVLWMFVIVGIVGALAATGMIETRNRRLEEIAP